MEKISGLPPERRRVEYVWENLTLLLLRIASTLSAIEEGGEVGESREKQRRRINVWRVVDTRVPTEWGGRFRVIEVES